MLELIYSIFINSDVIIKDDIKLKEYIKFCLEKSNENNYDCKHHILPKGKGLPFAKYKSFIEYPFNCSFLTYKDHYLAHYLLTLAISNKSSYFAFYAMHNKDLKLGRLNANDLLYDEYDKIKIICKEYQKPTREAILKGVETKLQINPETGLTFAKEYALKSAATMKKLGIYEITGKKISETKRKLNEADPYYYQKINEKQMETKIKNNSIIKGKDVNTALKVKIFDKNNVLIKECYGDFFNYFLDNFGLDFGKILMNTYKNNSFYKYNYKLKESIQEKIIYNGFYLRKENNIFKLYNSENILLDQNEYANIILNKYFKLEGTKQKIMRTYRENNCIKVNDRDRHYLEYEKFDGWFTRLIKN